MAIEVREALGGADMHEADRVACRAFAEYQAEFPEWLPHLEPGVPMTELALEATILVARCDGAVAGTVGYVGPGLEKPACFPREWAIVRMMAVDPGFRGRGVARALLDECVRLASRDGAAILGLFTSPAMKAAVSLYTSAGFRFEGVIDPVVGMPAQVLALRLAG